MKLRASLSLDLDNLWSYRKTHGDADWTTFPSYLDVVVPRFLEVLAARRLRVTVFVVGQDAALARNHGALRAIAAAGHEIGNHSFHHEPWMARRSEAEIEAELVAAEEAITAATGVRPDGFRGPGYCLAPALLRVLVRRGYAYDASTLPTCIGPLARAYYFMTARLTPEQKRERGELFGSWRDGRRPLRPYEWELDGAARLLEIPVTTLPLLRVPIHFSYVLYLMMFCAPLARAYFATALRACALAGVGPSLLLHPLDFLGGDEVAGLEFFPAMRIRGAVKRAQTGALLDAFARRFDVVPMGEHAAALRAAGPLRARPLDFDGR